MCCITGRGVSQMLSAAICWLVCLYNSNTKCCFFHATYRTHILNYCILLFFINPHYVFISVFKNCCVCCVSEKQIEFYLDVVGKTVCYCCNLNRFLSSFVSPEFQPRTPFCSFQTLSAINTLHPQELPFSRLKCGTTEHL